MAFFTEAEEQEFERGMDENYKCPYCPYKEGCSLWSCPNEMGYGEPGDMTWARPFSTIEGFEEFARRFGDFELIDLDSVLPDGVSDPGAGENILEIIEGGVDSVKVYHRYFYDWGPGTDKFHYFFVDPKSRAKTIELCEDLVTRVSFAQAVAEELYWSIDQAEVTELQWKVPIFAAYSPEDALIFAIENNLAEVAKILIKSGSDLDAKDVNGGSALHVAAGVGEDEIVRLLIDADVDFEAEDNDGRTPLMYAALGQESAHSSAGYGFVETARILLAAGADPHVTDGEGRGIRDLLKHRLLPYQRQTCQVQEKNRVKQAFLDRLSAFE